MEGRAVKISFLNIYVTIRRKSVQYQLLTKHLRRNKGKITLTRAFFSLLKLNITRIITVFDVNVLVSSVIIYLIFIS